MEQKAIEQNVLKMLWVGFVDLAFQAINHIGHRTIGEPKEFKVERIPIQLQRLPQAFSGFRIVQISDLHMGGWLNFDRLQQVADLVAAQSPDAIVITGDFLKGNSFTEPAKQGLIDLRRVLSPLAAAFPTFAVLGNHDYHTNPDAIREMLRSCSITDLTNAVFKITRDDQRLNLCGVDDVRHGDVRLDDVLAQLDEDSPAILLAHEPDFADISAATGRFDLQISGHSHGGQIVVPFFGPLVLPVSGRKYYSGLYRVGQMWQYTNRGVGMDRLALRINCPPEITVFTLESLET